MVSTLTLADVKAALRIDYDYDDDRIRNVVMPAALGRLATLTNRDAVEMDQCGELTAAYLMLCEDFYDGTDSHKQAIECICHSVQFDMVV